MLSVIVPVYNSTGDLRLCLAALANSQYADFEVLVVDDGSTEPVKLIVDLCQFRYMRIDGPSGPARARNCGAATLNGQYLVFIDADVCVHPDTLALFAERFTAEPEIAAIIGSYDDQPAHPSFLSRYKNLFHHYVHQHSDGAVNTFWSGCGAMRREVFFAFGGFDEQRYKRPAIEDIELGTWVSAAGHKIVLDSRIKAKHLKRWTLRSLLKTDIFDRGIPWTRLMLRVGAAANTLNVKLNQRICVALAYCVVLLALAALVSRSPWAFLLGAAVLALIITVLNFDFYRSLRAPRQSRFCVARGAFALALFPVLRI
ncbi:MAG: glycosyltransferase family A protein [Pyrinomonadaceae bacterium]